MEISDKNKQKWPFSADFFTLEYRTSVQRLSDHKTGRTSCVSQEHGIVERMV